MEVGDKVYIISSDSRSWQNRYCTVSRVGREYFEVKETVWEKFRIFAFEESTKKIGNQGVRTKDKYDSTLYWYPTEKAYALKLAVDEARRQLDKLSYLLKDDEVLDIVKELKRRKENG